MSKAINAKGHVFPIACVGKDQRAAIFYVHSQGEAPEEGIGVIEFHVRTTRAIPTPEDGRFFLLRLQPERSGVWRIKHIDHQGYNEFEGMGLAEALLVSVADQFSVEIWSQRSGQQGIPNLGLKRPPQHYKFEVSGEYERNQLATKMWDRLGARLDKHQIIHDQLEDIYRLVLRSPNQTENV